MFKVGKLGLILLLVLSSCVSKRVTETKDSSITLLHTSNRYGLVTPCGCSAGPIGGLDREANAVGYIREEGRGVFYVDSGNAFVPRKLESKIGYYQEKALAIVDMFNVSGLDALAPGPLDYELGVDSLIAASKRAKFPFISTNVKDKDGKTLFQPYVILERQGVKIAFVSLTPVGKVSDPRLKVEDPIATISSLMNELRSKADLIVGLSQMESAKDQELVNAETGINIIVGTDPGIALDRPNWGSKGQTLLVDTSDQGKKLGRMDIELKLPFKGFFSVSEIDGNKFTLGYYEQSLKKGSNEALQARYDELKKTGLFAPIEGGSTYEHGLLELDEKRFGKKNQITRMIIAEAKRLQKKAISE